MYDVMLVFEKLVHTERKVVKGFNQSHMKITVKFSHIQFHSSET